MPVLRFQNYTAAARKDLMVTFGMCRAEAFGDLDVIQDIEMLTRVPITGPQNGVNTTYTLATAPVFGHVFKNGKPCQRNMDFTLTGNILVFTSPPISTDLILVVDGLAVVTQGGGGGGGGINAVGDVFLTAVQGQTTFAPGFPISAPWVWLNGVKQQPGTSFSISGALVIFASGLDAGDIVEIAQ